MCRISGLLMEATSVIVRTTNTQGTNLQSLQLNPKHYGLKYILMKGVRALVHWCDRMLLTQGAWLEVEHLYSCSYTGSVRVPGVRTD